MLPHSLMEAGCCNPSEDEARQTGRQGHHQICQRYGCESCDIFDTEIKTWCIADEGVDVWSTCTSGTHMVCMYGKILTSILRVDVDMTSRTACDWVDISLVPM